MEKIKVGIVGAQFAAWLHAESYKRFSSVKMQAVASLDNLEKFSADYGIPSTYTDYQEMFLKENLDLLSVCVPNFLHKQIVVDAAEAGIKNIICEKPIATEISDARVMIDVCEKHNVRLMYAEDWLFAPALTRAKEIVEEGGIGKLLYIKAKETHNGSHSIYAQNKEYCGGGAMIHLGIHPVAFISFFAGSEVKEVLGMATSGGASNLVHQDYTGEDWSVAMLTLQNGVKGFVEANYITVGGMDDRVEIYGSEGNIHIDLTKGSPMEVYSRKGYGYALEKTDFTHGWTKPAVDEFLSLGYVNEIEHFVDCVINNKTSMPGTSGEDGLHALKAVSAIYESVQSGKLVTL
ncbi:MAG: Gfo/Idh/MocA family oxidoreductase [Bacteroidota bacterium]